MTTHDDDARRVALMVEELANREPFHLVLNATASVQLAALLQLVKRHPQLDANNRRTAIMIIEQVRAYFGGAPATLAAIRDGDDPSFDRPWET
jgi:hypothetical protein